ncbi:MAG: hypothetical protein IPH90_02500 [Thermomonas sp.]|nr:hypothetical protein [Thermomonas sp.]
MYGANLRQQAGELPMVTTTGRAKSQPIAVILGLMTAMVRRGQRQLNPKSKLRAVLEYPIGETLFRFLGPFLEPIGSLMILVLIIGTILMLFSPALAAMLWIAMGG